MYVVCYYKGDKWYMLGITKLRSDAKDIVKEKEKAYPGLVIKDTDGIEFTEPVEYRGSED